MSETMSQSQGQEAECAVTEDVHVLVDANGGLTGQAYEFALEPVPDQPGADYLCRDILNFRNAGKKKFTLHFHLQNRGGSDLRFMPNIDDAVWIEEGGGCPTRPSQAKDEFPVGEVAADGMSLTLNNENKKKKSFGYTLRFQPAGGGEPVPFDPVIENGGGGNDFC